MDLAGRGGVLHLVAGHREDDCLDFRVKDGSVVMVWCGSGGVVEL